MYIKKISIKNFRVFKEKTTFQLRPFTILTGPNNSGKSSFIKFLLLISSGLKRLNFYDGLHNLENYKSCLNWESKSDEIELELYDNKGGKLILKFYKEGLIKSLECFEQNEFFFSLSRKVVNKTISNGDFNEKIFETKITQKINYNLVKDIFLNNDFEYFFDLYKFENPSLVREILEKCLLFQIIKDGVDETLKHSEDLLIIQQNLFKECQAFVNIKYSELNFHELIDFMKNIFTQNLLNKVQEHPLFSNGNYHIKFSFLREHFFGGFINPNSYMLSENKEFNYLNQNKEYFKYLDKGFIFGAIFTLVDFDFFSKKINYLSTNRGNQKRVMMNSSEKDLNSIIVEFSRIDQINYEFIQQCLNILGIDGELEINRYENTISTFYILNNNKKIALADLGFGYSQVIPIILKVHNLLFKESILENIDGFPEFDNSKTLILEEPESNLHPNLQSKLAELLSYIHVKFNVFFIIETHSEYFIRKLQYLTAKNELKIKDSVIYYFNDDKYVSKTEPKVKEIFINEDGGLTDSFGPGFFDEATKLQFDLIRLQKQQMN